LNLSYLARWDLLVQWTADPHAGFTTGTPWMRANDDYAEGWNVQAQLGDNASVHAFYKHVLDYRKKSDLLVRPIRLVVAFVFNLRVRYMGTSR